VDRAAEGGTHLVASLMVTDRDETR
jgi:hypothetical protein